MSDPIEDYKSLGFTEAYEVVRTVELVGNDQRTYRIEVARAYKSDGVRYVARYYVQIDLAKGGRDVEPRRPEEVTQERAAKMVAEMFERVRAPRAIWGDIAEAWVDCATVDDALRQAMGFLSRRARVRPDQV